MNRIERHRRSKLEAHNCPHRHNVLYNLCRHCGHQQDQHHGGSCQGGADGQGCLCREFHHIEDRGDESQRGIGFHEIAFRYIARLAQARTQADAGEASLAFREGAALAQLPSRLAGQVARLWGRFTEWFHLDLDAYFAAEEMQVSAFCLSCTWRGDEADVVWKGSGSPTDPALATCPECGGPAVGATWIPDLVYVRPHEVEVIDWKTFFKGLTETQARQEFQLKFYLWQALHLWPGFAHYRFTFNFVRLGWQVSIRFTPEEIEAWSDEIKGIVLSIEESKRTNNYPAVPGNHCGVCRLVCPVVDNPFRMPVRITSQAERDAVAGQLLAGESKLKQLKQLLKGHCELEGGFSHAGQVFGFYETTAISYPADEVLQWLKDRKIDTSQIRLSADSLGKLVNPKHAPQAFLEFLDAQKAERKSWTFRHRKIGDDQFDGMKDVLGDDERDDEDG